MIEILGWICTLLVLAGYILNANSNYFIALIVWCVGDVGWIIYDYNIHNWSHAALSSTIILINVLGLYKKSKTKEIL